MSHEPEPLFTDVVLPLFDQPEAPARRVKSRKEQDDDANKIIWRRFKVSGVQCQDCVEDRANRTGIGAATWIRTQGKDQRALCYQHRAEYLLQESRDG